MPDAQPSVVSGAFRRPFREQVAFFRQKLGNRVPTERWDDLTGAAHDSAFMVAGAQKADLLADLGAAIDRSIAEGKSLEAFRRDFNAAVERNGWHGWTGEGTKGGRAWRTRTIYRTNASVSYAAGRRAQLEAANWAFWVYVHGGSKDPRPEHLHVFDGLVLPPDHPFWAKLYPPSDWGCSCYVVGARSERGARRLGGDPEKRLPDGWDKVDPVTGEPAGIGKGWGYAPGASVAGPVAAMAEKVRHWDYQIGKAFFAELPPAAIDELAEAYRRLPSVADDARRYARRVLGEGGEAQIQPVWTLGWATRSQRTAIFLAKPNVTVDVAGFDFSVAPHDIKHVLKNHGDASSEAARGQIAISADDYRHLPAIVARPDIVRDADASAAKEPLVLFEKVIGGVRYFALFAIHKKKRTLALKTFYARKA